MVTEAELSLEVSALEAVGRDIFVLSQLGGGSLPPQIAYDCVAGSLQG
jgi:hypothetical protein